ncbi:FecR domain-containing protein [Sphingobium sp. AN641]|uniref:FecR family protein n=1 Tax=Sphingobium sp. AN641 TaxID=3133443 RepID=UPI0030BD8F5B
MSLRENSTDIEAAATDWAVRVEYRLIDLEGQAELEHWLAGDSRRLGAYARARAVCVHARRAKALGSSFDPDRYNDVEPHASVSLETAATDFADIPAPLPRMTRRMLFGWAGAVAVVGGATVIGLGSRASAHVYRTHLGEVKLVPLQDGLSATLNTESSISVRYKSDASIVELTSGEVMFDVPYDISRPCIVVAGDTRTTGHGACFTVKNLDSSVAVLVSSGSVLIERISRPGIQRRIEANVRAIVDADRSIAMTAQRPAAVAREMAWREGMLAFDDTPLKEAAKEFSRFSNVKIQFADAAIEEKTVTGYFAANNPIGFAKAIAISMGLRTEGTDKAVTLRF